MRALYRSLLLMHPPAFRRRFAAEMLCIFDEAAATSGAFGLCLDALISLLRQWILRSGSWKLAAALLGAFLQVVAGGLFWLMLDRPPGDAGRPDLELAAMEWLLRFIVASVCAIIMLVFATSLWTRHFTRRRMHGDLR